MMNRLLNGFLKKQCLVLTLLVAALMAPSAFAQNQAALGVSAQASAQDRTDRQKRFEASLFIRSQPVILGALSLDLFAVLFGGATALLPIFARDVLHAGPLGLGLLRSASAVGALGGTIWARSRPEGGAEFGFELPIYEPEDEVAPPPDRAEPGVAAIS